MDGADPGYTVGALVWKLLKGIVGLENAEGVGVAQGAEEGARGPSGDEPGAGPAVRKGILVVCGRTGGRGGRRRAGVRVRLLGIRMSWLGGLLRSVLRRKSHDGLVAATWFCNNTHGVLLSFDMYDLLQLYR